jgi:ABC-type polysaccharide/polyol phosphate transport system ATPase subunit
VLGLGDQGFYARVLARLKKFRAEGKTMILASHSTELILMLCERALWIEKGRVVMDGSAEEVVAAYQASEK